VNERYIIEVERATKAFGRLKALDGLTLRVREGETYGLLGPNGSGKTTLIRAIAGVIRLTSGTVRVMGEVVPSRRVATQVGYMTQAAALYEELTVRENVSFCARLYGLAGRARERVDEVLELVRLTERADNLVRVLSGGMRQRTNLACALVHRPRLLLLDEPTVGVDPRLRQSLWNYFHQVNREGTTLIISTHIMEEAERCSRIGLMRAGRFLAEGSPAELKARAGRDDLESAFLYYEGEGKVTGHD